MILVVGATGSLGGRITRGLLAQGKAVRFHGLKLTTLDEFVRRTFVR